MLSYAQQSDIRLTWDVPTGILPSEAEMQDAARSGATTFVAWGTSYRGTDNKVKVGIVAQILQNGEPQGNPQFITTEAAQPTLPVHVIPHEQGFYILWNDKRNGEAIYGRSVDLNGVPNSAEEQRLGTAFMRSITSYGVRDDGSMLLVVRPDNSFSKSRTLWLLRFDGTFVAEPYTFSEIIAAHYPLDDGRDILRLEDGSLYDIGVDGSVGQVPISEQLREALKSGASQLQKNGTLVTLQDSTVRYYSDLYSETPSIEFTWPEYHLAVGNKSTVRRDSDGNFRLNYVVHHGFMPMDPDIVGQWTVADTLVELTISDQGEQLQRTSTVMRSDTVSYDFLHNNNNAAYLSFERAEIQSGCAGSQLAVVWKWRFTSKSSTVTRLDTIVVNVIGDQVNSAKGMVHLDCIEPKHQVARVKTDTASIVQTAWDGDTVTLHYPVAQQEQVQQHMPAILRRGGELYLANGLYRTALYTLSRVQAFEAGEIVEIGELSPSGLSSAGRGMKLLQSNEWYNRDFIRGNNIAFLSNSLARRDFWEVYSNNDAPSFYTHGYESYFPSVSGWKKSDNGFNFHATYEWNPNGSQPALNGWDVNADHGVLMIQYQNRQNGTRAIGSFDTSGTLLWAHHFKTSKEYTDLIVKNDTAYLAVRGDTIDFFNKAHFEGNAGLPPLSSTQPASHISLHGDKFLRYSQPDSVSFKLETFTFAGKPYQSTILSVPDTASEFFVVQSDHDSILAVLWAADGVRCTFLAPNLEVVEHNLPVSAARSGASSPSAVFRNDTLFAVWTDVRNESRDIYGATLASPDISHISSVENQVESWEQGGSRNRTKALFSTNGGRVTLNPTPNPAREETRVRFHLAQSWPVVVEVYNSLGEAVHQEALGVQGAGDHEVRLSVGGYAIGLYTVVLRVGPQTGTGKFVRNP